MNVPGGIAVEQFLGKQAVALSVIKQSAEAEQQLVAILDEAARSAPVSSVRGSNVNLLA